MLTLNRAPCAIAGVNVEALTATPATTNAKTTTEQMKVAAAGKRRRRSASARQLPYRSPAITLFELKTLDIHDQGDARRLKEI